jgi:GTPase subunit of restriction endonuclease
MTTQEDYIIHSKLIESGKVVIKKKDIDDQNNDLQYTKTDFLKEAFLSEKEYNELRQLLLYKKNVILQGPPGVGKTFLAKRLAYSILGKKEKRCVETIQFHQSYSYEDFILGFKPNENGFKLEKGVFYEFCERARNDFDKTHKYFFIIDESGRRFPNTKSKAGAGRDGSVTGYPKEPAWLWECALCTLTMSCSCIPQKATFSAWMWMK